MEEDLPVLKPAEVGVVRDGIEERKEPVLDPVYVREVVCESADRRGPLELPGRHANVQGVRVRADPRGVANDGPFRVLPEQEGEHADIREDGGDQDHGDIRRVHQPDWVAAASPPGHAMGQGELNPRRLDVGDDQENRDRPDERDERIRGGDHDLFDSATRELAPGISLQVVDGLRNRAGGNRAAGLRGLPVERPREDLLGDAARDEQGDPRSDSPLRDDLVHQEHEI